MGYLRRFENAQPPPPPPPRRVGGGRVVRGRRPVTPNIHDVKTRIRDVLKNPRERRGNIITKIYKRWREL